MFKVKSMTYSEAIEYIHSVSWKGSVPGLSRITALCEMLGNPEKDLKCIHIGGTNGKGSTSAYLTSVLWAAGYKVGTFTSPYVRTFNERIAVNGIPVSDELLAEVVGYVRPFADMMEDRPTEFELITAIGFEVFRRERVDIVVLEVGMGGRFDSTNIIESPLLSVITGISLDHTQLLGDTLDKIAWEKAGILKAGRPAVLASLDGLASTVFLKEAAEKDVSLHYVSPSDIRVREISLCGIVMDYKERKNIKTTLIGAYQSSNIALVLEVCDCLCKEGYCISEDALYRGIAKAKWPARFELLSSEPVTVFDGGHNEEGVRAALDTARAVFGGKNPIVLTGVMADKAYEKMVGMIAEVASEVFTLKPDNPRALDAEMLAEAYRNYGVKATAGNSIDSALEAAHNAAKEQELPLLILGSLYLYKDVYKAFE